MEPKGRPRIEAGKEQLILRLRLTGKTYAEIARERPKTFSVVRASRRNARHRNRRTSS